MLFKRRSSGVEIKTMTYPVVLGTYIMTADLIRGRKVSCWIQDEIVGFLMDNAMIAESKWYDTPVTFTYFDKIIPNIDFVFDNYFEVTTIEKGYDSQERATDYTRQVVYHCKDQEEAVRLKLML